MLKVVLPSSYNFDQPIARLVNSHSHGVDSDWLVKRASSTVDVFKGLKPKDSNHSLIHLIAMGASDSYPQNRNGDIFYKSARKLDLVDPNWDTLRRANGSLVKKSADTFADSTRSGLIERGHTFAKFGHVFKNHCFPAGTAVLMGDRSRKPIEEIQIGEIVQTSDGPLPVTDKFQRGYSGPGFRFKVRGLPYDLVCTDEHPIKIYRREQIHCRHKYSRLTPNANHEYQCKEIRLPIGKPEFVKASDISKKDYLLCPVPSSGDVRLSPAISRLLGWVASEGYLHKDKNIIQFTFGKDNIKDIEAVKGIFKILDIHLHELLTKLDCVALTACNKELHLLLSQYITGTKDKKTFTDKIYELDDKSLQYLLEAYIDGDGCISTYNNRRQLRIRSSSDQMLYKLSDICRILGAEATINLDRPAHIMVSHTNQKEYLANSSGCVSVKDGFIEKLASNSRKFKSSKTLRSVSKVNVIDNHQLMRIDEIEELYVNEPVYNLEVAGPNDYIANEVVVHNCNKAHSGDPIYGEIVKQAYNHDMDRQELMIQVPHGKDWDEDLEKLAQGEDIPFSMACFVDPSIPVLTNRRGYIPLEYVREGDLVLTHKRRWRKVTKKTKRKYSGKVYSFELNTSPIRFSVTEDHPWFAILSETHASQVISENPEAAPEEVMKATCNPSWHHAKHLQPGDALTYVYPDSFIGYKPVINEYFAALLGSIVAGIETSPAVITCLREYLGIDILKDISIGPATYNVYPGLFSSSSSVKKAFIGSVIDNFENIIINDSVMHLMHNDMLLLLQIRDLLMSLSVLASVSYSSTYQSYTLSFEAALANNFIEYSGWLRKIILPDTEGSRYLQDLHVPHFISEISETEVESCWVYNLEVDEDESYVVGGLISHNCKVPYDICNYCGHKAKNRQEYCKHAASQLNDMLKSGHVMGVVNDDPTFFDISRVIRPADRIAWSLVKAASGQLLSGAELAESAELQLLPDISVLMEGEPEKVASRMSILNKLATIEKTIPVNAKLHGLANSVSTTTNSDADKEIDKLSGQRQKLASVFAKLADKQICLDMEKFARLVLGSSYRAELVKEASLGLSNLYGDSYSRLETISANSAFDPDFVSYSTDGEKLANHLEADMSISPELLRKRAIFNSIHRNHIKLADCAKVNYSEAAQALRDQYAAYQISFVESLGQRSSGLEKLASDFVIVQNHVQTEL